MAAGVSVPANCLPQFLYFCNQLRLREGFEIVVHMVRSKPLQAAPNPDQT
jgi:hypothetical protein